MRFVIVATAVRGAVVPAELLDDANQWRAFSAWRQAESCAARAEWELRELCGNTVVWARGWQKVVPPSPHVDRLMELAGRAG